MEGFGGLDRDSKASFWKKNTKTVPGRPSPKRDMSHTKGKPTTSGTSFEDFQNSVSDAWDIGDDEFYVISDVKISKKVAQSTALSVINSHRNAMSESGKDGPGDGFASYCDDESALSQEKRAEAMQRLASQREMLPSPQHHSSSSQYSSSPPSRKHVPGHPRAMGSALGRPQPGLVCKQLSDRDSSKVDKFQALLEVQNTNLDDLRHLSWSGIPAPVRGTAWRLLSGYLPANMERRQHVLDRKREEYWNFVKQYYDSRLEDSHEDTFRQIHIDIPRMSPLIALFQQIAVQEMFERILFIWAIRHPASGYVQGMNDLVTPFFVVFLEEVLPLGEELDIYDVSQLLQDQRDIIEADSFWCMSKFLDSIQDNYTFAQPGIQQKVIQLKELVCRVDVPLHRHLQSHEVDYLQFSFRWMNNLLMRELPLRCTIRLWDTYLSEPDGFGAFHLYVCAAFLLNWRKELLRQRDFQGLMLFLQNLPTHNWSDMDVSLMVAEAFRLKYMFADAPNHLQGGSGSGGVGGGGAR